MLGGWDWPHTRSSAPKEHLNTRQLLRPASSSFRGILFEKKILANLRYLL